ncbi:hypothetical protein LA345_15025 [Burkholderia vietnamiensis]|nr:hypothetical protein [Burkholderia vietnamiensis]
MLHLIIDSARFYIPSLPVPSILMELRETYMAVYCITAANHENPENHVASTFKLWLYGATTNTWAEQKSPATAKQVVELIENGHEVFTAKIGEKGIRKGAPVEVELRIAKNETNYPISEMPEF